MQRRIIGLLLSLVFLLSLIAHLSAQQQNKPSVRITSLRGVPSEPVAPGSCTYSISGYLIKGNRTDLTESELGTAIYSDLRQGYIVTVYPPTKNGIFAYSECPAGMKPNEVKHP
jgi:hypothetical protein